MKRKSKEPKRDRRSLKRLDTGSDPGNVFLLNNTVNIGSAMYSDDGLYRVTRIRPRSVLDFQTRRRWFKVELVTHQDTHLMIEIGQRINLKDSGVLYVHSFTPHLPKRYSSTGIKKGIVVGSFYPAARQRKLPQDRGG